MKTAFMLMAQYDGKVVIPIDVVCRDYFPQFTPTKVRRKDPLRRIETAAGEAGTGAEGGQGHRSQ
jgi:Pyocin activator protein PrtN